jgi:predicted phosphodiesterase
LRAVLYDVHGNLPALEAVLADASRRGVDGHVLGGDLALFGAWPAETVERLLELRCRSIRGNTDRWLIDASDAPANPLVERSLEFCRDALGKLRCDELGALPPTVELDGALVCHASPRSDMASFAPEPSSADAELLANGDPDVVVFGHTHVQFMRRAGTRTLVNPGSVGLPFDGDPRAAYALWRRDAGFELVRIEYDWEPYAARLHERLEPALGDAAGTLVRRLEQAAPVD